MVEMLAECPGIKTILGYFVIQYLSGKDLWYYKTDKRRDTERLE